jgi:hypothetical protein
MERGTMSTGTNPKSVGAISSDSPDQTQVDHVAEAFATIERVYRALSSAQQDTVEAMMREAGMFTRRTSMAAFFRVAENHMLRQMHSKRSRPPSKQIRARNDAWLADHEGSAGKKGMSLDALVAATGRPKSTIRAGLREAEARREEALATTRRQEHMIEGRKRVAAQLAKLPRGNNRGGVTNSKWRASYCS